ncbi:MAG: exopolysaccharide Pel transporter PelG, partial [Alkalispirochaeta sp.]
SAGIGAVLGIGIALLGSLSVTVAAATIAVAFAVSVSWIAMLMVSLLTRFRAIVGAYLAGGFVTVGTITGFSPRAFTAEAVAALSLFASAVGTVVVTAVLTLTVERTLGARDRLRRNAGARQMRRQPAARVSSSGAQQVPLGTLSQEPGGLREPRGILQPVSQFITLPAQTLRRIGRIGTLLTAILWVDKLVFWAAYGRPLGGTTLTLLPTYDVLVFVSQLFLVPAMVFFVVRVETTTYRGVRTILRAVRGETYREVERAKSDLFEQLNRLFTTQTGLALTIVVVAWLLSPQVAPQNPAVFVRVTVASQLYFLMYSSVVTLLYISDYRGALTLLAVVCAVAVIGSALTVILGNVTQVGYSYLAAAALGAVVARQLRNARLVVVDRYLLTRALM